MDGYASVLKRLLAPQPDGDDAPLGIEAWENPTLDFAGVVQTGYLLQSNYDRSLYGDWDDWDDWDDSPRC